MITFEHKGNFKHTESFLKRLMKKDFLHNLEAYAQRGVDVLKEYTPKRTGETAASWYYTISDDGEKVKITWSNSSLTNDGTPKVILLQYGHGTGTGGYVVGQDFINPAIKPIFDEISESVWKEVRRK